MKASAYLYFKGDCEDALGFYQTLGLGEVKGVMRWGGTPMAERAGPGWERKILHATLEGGGVEAHGSATPDAESMRGASVLVETDDLDRASSPYGALSSGGSTGMPFTKMFWGGHLGNLRDKFGVQWTVVHNQR